MVSVGPRYTYKPYTPILKFNRSRTENYRRQRPSSVNPTEHYARAGQYSKEVWV
jgi:hypothetical protein